MRRLLLTALLWPTIVYAQVDIQSSGGTSGPTTALEGTPTASLPAECDDGTLVYDSTEKVTKECTTDTWTAIASGGLTNFTEAESTAAPNDTVYVDSFTAAGASTNVDAALVPKGSGALLTQIPNNATSGGNKRGAGAVDLQGVGYIARSLATQVASGAGSVIGGGGRNTASQQNATVGGGYSNTASGSRSTVGGGEWNTASSAQATISGGQNNTASTGDFPAIGGGYSNAASQTAATIAGGYDNTCSGTYCAVGGGYQNTAAATSSTVGGGQSNSISAVAANSYIGGGFSNSIAGAAYYSTVSGGQSNVIEQNTTHSTIGGGYLNIVPEPGLYGTIPGGYGATTRGTIGAFAYASGYLFGVGEAQWRNLVTRRVGDEFAATNQPLTTNGAAAVSTNTLFVQDFAAYGVEAQVIAGGGTAGYWNCSFLATNDGAVSLLGPTCVANVCTCTEVVAGGSGASVRVAVGGFSNAEIQVSHDAFSFVTWVAVWRIAEYGG